MSTGDFMIKRFFTFLIGLFAVVVGLVPATTFTVGASAAESVYSSALEDLKKVETFDESVYEQVDGDASLNLITIAESTDDDVFAYVYQSATTYTASSINISIDAENVNTYSNLPLTLLSQDGVFQKYRIEEIAVSDLESRVYEISSILRPFDAEVDTPATGDEQVVSEVSYPVGKRFEFNADGMSVTDIELISVTDKYVGFMRYTESSFWTSDTCDVHYVAFSTDKKMDRLLKADVYYVSQTVTDRCYNGNWTTTRGATTENYAYLSAGNSLIWESGNWYLSYQREFPMIMTTKAFIATEEFSHSYDAGILETTTVNNIKATSKDEISALDWVLRFEMTDYEYSDYSTNHNTSKTFNYSIVSDVSILRLKYETDGEVFNLGVVDNKQSGDTIPDNDFITETRLNWLFWLVFSVVVITVLYLIPFTRPFIVVVFKSVGYVLASPFFLIRWIVGKIRGD